MFVVVVEFNVRQDAVEIFLQLLLENARLSKEVELGCKQFDVCQSKSAPNDLLLYEVYVDQAAFDAHLRTRHFLEFDALTREMITKKIVRTYAGTDVNPAGPPR